MVNPSDIVNQYGADTLRLYEMFMGPLEASKPWSNQGVEGAHKFLERVYRILIETPTIVEENISELDYIYHQTVKKVTEDFENLSFNTAISQMMIFINEVYKVKKISREYAEGFIKMLSCITPHLGEEMWNLLDHKNTIAYEKWPVYDESKLTLSTIEIAVQICGKTRGSINVNINSTEQEIQDAALNADFVKTRIAGKEIKRIIVIKNKIINIVAI